MIICRIIFCCLAVMGLGMALAKHGETEVKTYNFGATLLSTAIEFTLLYFGGFFN